jgi:hypothetical protein
LKLQVSGFTSVEKHFKLTFIITSYNGSTSE